MLDVLTVVRNKPSAYLAYVDVEQLKNFITGVDSSLICAEREVVDRFWRPWFDFVDSRSPLDHANFYFD